MKLTRRTKKALLLVGGVALAGGVVYLATSSSSPALPQSIHPTGLSWGATVSAEMRAAVLSAGQDLAIDPSYLMAVMRAESGINSHIHIIPAGLDANGNMTYKRSYNIPIEEGTIGGGLIGFMSSTARGLGTNLANLLALGNPEQMQFVKLFFSNHQKSGVLPRNPSLWRLYMSTFLPAFAHHADDPSFVLAAKDSPIKKLRKIYVYNAAADRDKDGEITVGEAMAKIDKILIKGLQKGLVF